jgi:hypothetical protein
VSDGGSALLAGCVTQVKVDAYDGLFAAVIKAGSPQATVRREAVL